MLVAVDQRARADIVSALREKGFEPILMPPAPELAIGVSSHTDMLLFVGFGRLFCHASYYVSNKELIDRICKEGGLELTLSSECFTDKYPSDVLFNACLLKDFVICNKKTVSSLILASAKDNGYTIIDVPQGYTKCSVCIASDGAILTADTAIAKACKAHNIDVLEIHEGYVSLPPYNFGFIGGASGTYGNEVYFCGNIDLHPDAKQIKEFIQKHGKTAVCLSQSQLQDVGSLFFI